MPAAVRVMSAKRAAAIWCALACVALAVLMASLALGSVSLAPGRVLMALMPSHAFTARPSNPAISPARSCARCVCRARWRASRAARCSHWPARCCRCCCAIRWPSPTCWACRAARRAFALVAMIAGCAWWIVDAGAFAGAFVSILLVLGLARRELWRGEPQDTLAAFAADRRGDRGRVGRADHAAAQPRARQPPARHAVLADRRSQRRRDAVDRARRARRRAAGDRAGRAASERAAAWRRRRASAGRCGRCRCACACIWWRRSRRPLR